MGCLLADLYSELSDSGTFINPLLSRCLLVPLIHYDLWLCGNKPDCPHLRLCLAQAFHLPILVQSSRIQVILVRPFFLKKKINRSSLVGPTFVSARYIVDIVQATYLSCCNVQSVKPTLNGRASMGTSFASRLSLEQVQSITSVALVSNYPLMDLRKTNFWSPIQKHSKEYSTPQPTIIRSNPISALFQKCYLGWGSLGLRVQ